MTGTERTTGPEDQERIEAVLKSCGFQVRYRQHDWIECLVTEDHASWLGRGPDIRSALLDVVSCMVPSRLLRERVFDSTIEPVSADSDEMAENERDDARQAAETISDQQAKPDHESPAAGPPGSTPAPAIRLGPPRMDPDDAASILDDLKQTIDDSRNDVSMLAPIRIRLVLLGWVATARDIQTRRLGDEDVMRRVSDIIRSVRVYTKTLWPGSIYAMKLDCAPCDCSVDLPGQRIPGSWIEVAVAADRALDEELARTDVDDDGWADTSAMYPLPRRPDDMMS